MDFDPKGQRYFVRRSALEHAFQLSDDEAILVTALALELSGKDGLPFCEPAYNAALKLERGFPSKTRAVVRRMARAIKIRSSRPAFLSGKATHYQALIDALKKRHAVRIDYESLTEWERITTTLHPYTLMFSQHSWYVFGWSSLHSEVRNFNLVRIATITPLVERYSIPREFDVDRHLGNAWQLIRDTDRDSHVVLRFKSLVARNVAEVNWHKTQQTRFLPDGSLDFRVTVSGLSEISWWILGYGDQVEVLKPLRLRQIVAQRAKNMVDMYNVR